MKALVHTPMGLQGRPRRRARGLTLIELMIVLAVLAVLGALALPSYGARAQRARLQGTAQMLATDVAQTRFEAARRGQPLYLQSAGAGSDGWCWAIATTAGCPCGQQQACELSHVAAADHPGVSLADPLDLRFDPDGNAGSRAAVRLSSRGGETLRVEVSALGRARVCSETAARPGIPSC